VSKKGYWEVSSILNILFKKVGRKEVTKAVYWRGELFQSAVYASVKITK
jgi:hypothetical protein